ncbi:hypothetical protein ACFFHM_14200 [Halalkalibacter kiskunsagensis]|uniref:Plasmid segregation centromere-binding protein ParR n=1 Tax=Halalkalibacter kiskunsagensis TaxID=1548599 RepID=A0ABV6KE64_9BACI
MTKKGMTGIQRGQAITFRLPSDTPDHIIKQLQKLKETERRNFSSKIAEFTIEGVSNSLSKEKETVTIPLPRSLSKEQRSWLKHAHSEALLGNVVYQLLADPVRATSILASLTSNAIDIDEALYLQENEMVQSVHLRKSSTVVEQDIDEVKDEINDSEPGDMEDDLLDFDFEKARQELASADDESQNEDEEEDAEDLLGDFLSAMNK